MTKRCHITNVVPKSSNFIENIAEKFLQSFQPTHLEVPGRLNVEDAIDPYLAKEYGYGLDVVEDCALEPGLLGVTDFKQKLVILPETEYKQCLNGNPTSRFTVCHEIGHVLTIGEEIDGRISRLSNGGGLDKWELPRRRGELKSYADPEWQADWFAASVLMPRRTFWKAMDEAIEGILCNPSEITNTSSLLKIVIKNVATIYNVSSSAARLRREKLLMRARDNKTGFNLPNLDTHQFKNPKTLRRLMKFN